MIASASRSSCVAPVWDGPERRSSPPGTFRSRSPFGARHDRERRVLQDLEALAEGGVLGRMESAALDVQSGLDHSSNVGGLEWSFDGVSFDGAASSSQCSTAWGSPAVQASQEASRALGFNDKRMQEAEQRAWDYSRQRAQLGWPH